MARRPLPNLPSPETVVAEDVLRPPQRTATAATAGRTAPAREYRVIRTTQVDEYDVPVSAAAVPSFAAAQPRRGDAFRGTKRKAAKISLARGRVERFDDLRDLIRTLPKDSKMTTRKPPLKDGETSDRVDEEKRNVRVRAFLYAASREDDNDFHLIIGRDPAAARMFMTAEISGLPPPSSPLHSKLKEARAAYKAFFNAPRKLPGTTYDFYPDPIPVELEGSLFFDVSHASGGRPGPDDLRADIPTVWEIHPISRIVFEP
jgi:hypothetical protein